MATNDVNLQVINSMTQDKMNSLKDANGKIPSLANQLIMTNEEDVNLSQMRIEVVYNKDSSDSNINWGYASGIQGSTSAITKDLSKFKMLFVYYQCYFANSANTGGNANCLMLDLERINENHSIASNEVAYFTNGSPNSTARFSFQARYNHSSKALNFLFGYQANAELNNGQYFVYKIEGILKEPAMIYTGAELHEGNGISIENGVISRATTKKQLTGGYYDCASANIPISLSTILQYDFISVDVIGRSGGGGYLGTETKLIPVDTIIQNPSGNAGNNITYYNQRYALLGVIHLKFNTNEIVTLGIFASPYNNTNLEAVSNDKVFVGNVWGFKL